MTHKFLTASHKNPDGLAYQADNFPFAMSILDNCVCQANYKLQTRYFRRYCDLDTINSVVVVGIARGGVT